MSDLDRALAALDAAKTPQEIDAAGRHLQHTERALTNAQRSTLAGLLALYGGPRVRAR